MRHYVIASHGGFSKGIYESIKIIIGEQAGVDIITAFIAVSYTHLTAYRREKSSGYKLYQAHAV